MSRADAGVVLAPAVRQLELLRSRQLSIAELAEAHIAQIERLNPCLNAFADFDADRVRAEARRMDAAQDGRRALFGLPVTVKSSIATAGFRCEIGSLLNKDERPDADAVVVERLRAAGALILGTTNCPEFLMAYETANLLHGQTRNPWDLERTPGGSSGGESAAIAAACQLPGLGVIAAARCGFPRISQASAHSNQRRDAFRAGVICRRASDRFLSLARLARWRERLRTLRCCSAH